MLSADPFVNRSAREERKIARAECARPSCLPSREVLLSHGLRLSKVHVARLEAAALAIRQARQSAEKLIRRGGKTWGQAFHLLT